MSPRDSQWSFYKRKFFNGIIYTALTPLISYRLDNFNAIVWVTQSDVPIYHRKARV